MCRPFWLPVGNAAVMVAAIAGVVVIGIGVLIDNAWVFTPGAAVALFGSCAFFYLKLKTRPEGRSQQ